MTYMYRLAIVGILLLVQAEVGAESTSLGEGAVVDHRPMGTAELTLLCVGEANIPMEKKTQQLACLHYLQGFLDVHSLTIGYLKAFQEKGDPTVRIPSAIITCVNTKEVSATSLLKLFLNKYGTPEAMARTPSAYTALFTLLLDNFPCVRR